MDLRDAPVGSSCSTYKSFFAKDICKKAETETGNRRQEHGEKKRIEWLPSMKGEASFVFRNAVNPSLEAPGETPVSHGPENKCSASPTVRGKQPLRFIRSQCCSKRCELHLRATS